VVGIISPSISIKELAKEDLAKAAVFYAQGVLMEVPPGSTASQAELTEIMRMDLELYMKKKRNRIIWLAEEGEAVKGIVDFFLENSQIHIRFLGAIPTSIGTGTLLLHHLARFARSKNVERITAEVSQSDPRAWNFYFKHLGFQNRGICTEEPGLTVHLAEIQPQILLDNINKDR
jgi:hypothetical protein